MVKANIYREYNIISLHTHLGGADSELEIGTGKLKSDINFNEEKAQNDLDKLKDIGFKILALTNHNVLSVKNYLNLKKSNDDILLLPGIECDIKKEKNNKEIIHMCVIFDDSISEHELEDMAKKYNDFLIENGDNYILINQLFKVISGLKVILYPHGNKKKGISYSKNNGDLVTNEEIYDEICNLEAIYPFFIDVKQEFHKYTLQEKIKDFYVSDYKKSLSYTSFLISIDREDKFTDFPFTYFWGEPDFSSIYVAGLIGDTNRFVQEKDIIKKSPVIARMEIKDKKTDEIKHNLKFSHGINTIIGDSGSGKTLILNYIYKLIAGEDISNLTTTNAKGNYDEIYQEYTSTLYDENDEIIEEGSISPYIGKNIYRRFILALDENGSIEPNAIFENLNIKENVEDFLKMLKNYENKLNRELSRRREKETLLSSLSSYLVTFSNTIKSIVSNKSVNKYNFESFSVEDNQRNIRNLIARIKLRITDYVIYNKMFINQKEILLRYNLLEEIENLKKVKDVLLNSIRAENSKDIASINEMKKKLSLIESYNTAIRSVDEKNGEKVKKRNQSIGLNRNTANAIASNILLLKTNKDKEETDLKLLPETIMKSIKLQESIENVEIVTTSKESFSESGFFENICKTVKGKGNIPVNKVRNLKITSDADVSKFIDEFIQFGDIKIDFDMDYKKYLNVDIKIKGFENKDVALSEMSAGMLSKFYIRTLINNEIKKMNYDSIIFFDEPDANLSKTFIYTELVKKFKEMRIDNQIFFTTHEPLLIVNADSNNLICCENTSKILDGLPKFRFESGTIINNKFFSGEDVNSVDDIIDLFANMIDGNKNAIKIRNKLYLGGTHYE